MAPLQAKAISQQANLQKKPYVFKDGPRYKVQSRATYAGGYKREPPYLYRKGRAKLSGVVSASDAKGKTYHVNVYWHPKVGGKLIQFPDREIKKRVDIKPTGDQKRDIHAANRQFGKDDDYDWSKEYGQPMTWHHDFAKGKLVLVPRLLHQKIGHWGGNSLWY